MPSEGPLSPPINGDSDSPLAYNGTCSLPGRRPALGSVHPHTFFFKRRESCWLNAPALPAELPTPLKKRRLSPLDACMSESSTPYGSPCATPTRADQSETPATPVLPATPPRPRTEEPSAEPPPSTPTQTLNVLQEVRARQSALAVVAVGNRTRVTESVLVPQSDSSVESSPEVSRKPSVQEVSKGRISTRGYSFSRDCILGQQLDLRRLLRALLAP